MPKTKQQKIDIVAALRDRIAKSKSIVFADYKGMNMAQLSALRTQLEDLSAQFTVTKNNLIKIALKENGLKADDAIFEGPVARAGFLNGEYLTDAQVNQLAQLPGKDELRAKIVGSLGSPLYGIVGVLQANLRNLVYALDAIRVQKGGE
ncbi:50S ribosomal protein L10 [Candidatus Daviesbacteria bacterium]|nr:50S ribosomal protein L10 [Candidatus Daviesbacteria bacterium]